MPRNPAPKVTPPPAPKRRPGRPPASPPVPMKLVRALIVAGDHRARVASALRMATERACRVGARMSDGKAFDRANNAAHAARRKWEAACAAIIDGGV